MRYRDVIKNSVSRLVDRYGESEARAMVEYAVERYKDWTPTMRFMHLDDEASDLLVEHLDNVCNKLGEGWPLQYILGYAPFHGMNLRVDRSTLIPRPETSQLVDIIVDRLDPRPDLRLLDIGTGSGAIAIALARSLRFAEVDAIDISSEALDIARMNASDRHVKINFICTDILTTRLPRDTYDLIVSNPPYITESERRSLPDNVAHYEPPRALYVPDEDPLRFYRVIADKAFDSLHDNGLIAFEINQRFGRQTCLVVEQARFVDVELIKDYKGNDRFVLARKPQS